MSRPKFGCEVAAEMLTKLADHCSEPAAIDEAVHVGQYSPEQLVLTSMGTRNKAVITPFYPGLQLEPKLADRIAWSGIFGRPFAEASIGTSRSKGAASLTLRLCMDPRAEQTISESSWIYPLSAEDAVTKSTWDVVDAIRQNALDGEAIPQRSGLVAVTDKRFKAGNWAVSYTSDPNAVVEGISTRINSLALVKL